MTRARIGCRTRLDGEMCGSHYSSTSNLFQVFMYDISTDRKQCSFKYIYKILLTYARTNSFNWLCACVRACVHACMSY